MAPRGSSLAVYVERLPCVPIVPLLFPNFGRETRPAMLYQNDAFLGLRERLVEVTADPARADVFLAAHNFATLRARRAHLAELSALARAHGKPIVVFWHGDLDAPVDLPGAIVFRTSIYRRTRRPEELAMPAYAEDLLRGEPLAPRAKGAVPVVGFCGWARYHDVLHRLRTQGIDAAAEARALLLRDGGVVVRRRGISIRRRAMAALESSGLVRTRFLARDHYSGRAEMTGERREVARREYRDNLLGSDLALVVKGDGNFSYRFYEALSLGRVPLLRLTAPTAASKTSAAGDHVLSAASVSSAQERGDVDRRVLRDSRRAGRALSAAGSLSSGRQTFSARCRGDRVARALLLRRPGGHDRSSRDRRGRLRPRRVGRCDLVACVRCPE